MKNASKKHIKQLWYRFGWYLGREPFETMDYAHYRYDLGVNYWDYMGRLGKSIVLQVKKDGGNCCE